MKEETFTDYVLQKLQISGAPLVIQEVVVKDLGEIILQRAYTEIVSSLNEEDSDRLSIYFDSGDLSGVYGFLTANDVHEKKFSLVAQEVVEDFVKQLNS